MAPHWCGTSGSSGAADFFPNETEAVWQLRSAAWIYVVADARRAGNALLTLIVDDLEELLGELVARGLEPGAIEAVTTLTRKPEITDPEGNKIAFAENRTDD